MEQKVLPLKTAEFNHKLRPLKCCCADPIRWRHDEGLMAEGLLTIHETTEPGVYCTVEQRKEKCPGCGYYFWFTTGGKK
jgi:hypothetical protein